MRSGASTWCAQRSNWTWCGQRSNESSRVRPGGREVVAGTASGPRSRRGHRRCIAWTNQSLASGRCLPLDRSMHQGRAVCGGAGAGSGPAPAAVGCGRGERQRAGNAHRMNHSGILFHPVRQRAQRATWMVGFAHEVQSRVRGAHRSSSRRRTGSSDGTKRSLWARRRTRSEPLSHPVECPCAASDQDTIPNSYG